MGKKKQKRKLRKQLRKQREQPFDKWLTPKLNKRLKELARVMTMMPPKYPREIHNHKFYCKKCKRIYCIHVNGSGITYCENCFYKRCEKEIRDIRLCEECEPKEGV